MYTGIHVHCSQIHEETALAPHSNIKMGTEQTQAGTPGASIFPITSIPIKDAGTHNTADLHLFSTENNLLSLANSFTKQLKCLKFKCFVQVFCDMLKKPQTCPK